MLLSKYKAFDHKTNSDSKTLSYDFISIRNCVWGKYICLIILFIYIIEKKKGGGVSLESLK